MAEFRASVRVGAPRTVVFAEVADLATYPHWLGIVGRAEPVPAHGDDGGPAWSVDLQARLGPLVRRKTLRMVRTATERDESVRFERMEHDGRTHGEWVLQSELAGDSPVELTMTLSYSGLGWIPGLDLLLAGEARRAGAQLEERVKRGNQTA